MPLHPASDCTRGGRLSFCYYQPSLFSSRPPSAWFSHIAQVRHSHHAHVGAHDNSDSLETPSLLNIKAIAFLLPVALFIFTVSFVPLPAEFTSYNPLTSTAARLVVLGTIILGLLSGLGAVNGAWGTFARKAAVPSAASIASAENALDRVRSDLRERTRDLDAYGASKV
ncbi:hypothetical protein J3R82DRAFT_8734 [Butyriboletus roseoflavus]|nr:hypothetical protein J3R82DRAFT_8734 [Butyriboletus roseoflavus]